MTPEEFINKWSAISLTERAAAQSHFIDLCAVLGVQTPTDADQTGEFYTFEKLTDKDTGHRGFADVWYQNRFAWEYKKQRANLDDALTQLRQYAGALGNPPLLVVCDMARIRIVPQFTGYVTTPIEFTTADLLQAPVREQLRQLWLNPEALKPTQTREGVTLEAAKQFTQIAESMRARNAATPHDVAHFLIRILFCLFAESIGLLPQRHFTGMLERFRGGPTNVKDRIAGIFAAMAEGKWDGNEKLRYFNGDLFTAAAEEVIYLYPNEIGFLWNATDKNWSSVAPSIFGTLFERGLDPAKRAQIGAHYTSEADILAIVEPVVLAPLRRQWSEDRARLDALAQKGRAGSKEAEALLGAAQERVRAMTVLDPACGSGNFLYVTLRLLHELEFEVITWRVQYTGQRAFPTVGPQQLHGIEINPYAAELARAVIWIGHLQWMLEHGYDTGEPVLQRLENIVCADALMTEDHTARKHWPQAKCIVSNPPFLGGNKVRAELGDAYVESLWRAYDGSVGAFADLVCYFVEHARSQVQTGATERVGLITTNSIRGGVNRQVIDSIKGTILPNGKQEDLFMAWADRPWILDGAAVRISMLGFDDGQEPSRTLDGQTVGAINPDLTSAVDLTKARRLAENAGIGFMGIKKDAPFDIDEVTAQKMIAAKGNPNGRPNSDVVKSWMNALDITRRLRKMWIIDFNDMSMSEAALYEAPFEHIKQVVQPIRVNNNRQRYKDYWWQFAEARPGMRRALAPYQRYIATPTVAKHRLFVWLDKQIIPDHQLIAFARDDDYTFGVLHSQAHELWALRLGTSLEDRPRYTPTTTFETFPFPHADAAQKAAIGEAARRLVAQRDAWLNPPDADEAELKRRTLTNLYNARPQWLANAHAALDRAVYAAYGWQPDISDDAILRELLAENLRRSGASPQQAEEEVIDADDDAIET
ncbi:MAG: class I SAM-dependent DNA methyltransferase [Ktedonobacterales bacterium]|nr:class I SAM-dependent DNA methyltransferase [Ktedonobacterales bacterium]